MPHQPHVRADRTCLSRWLSWNVKTRPTSQRLDNGLLGGRAFVLFFVLCRAIATNRYKNNSNHKLEIQHSPMRFSVHFPAVPNKLNGKHLKTIWIVVELWTEIPVLSCIPFTWNEKFKLANTTHTHTHTPNCARPLKTFVAQLFDVWIGYVFHFEFENMFKGMLQSIPLCWAKRNVL